MQLKKKIISPCTKDCKVVQGVCEGCSRSYQEVISWLDYTDDERKHIFDRCISENAEVQRFFKNKNL